MAWECLLSTTPPTRGKDLVPWWSSNCSSRLSYSTVSILTRNGTGTNHDAVICHVGNTRTSLYIQLYDEVDATPMRNAITNAQRWVLTVIRASGDSWLPKREDPFSYDDKLGAHITARSTQNHHLTWGILGNALKGLQDCVIRNEWYQDAVFQIFDGPWGHVGDGSVLGSAQSTISTAVRI